MFEKMKNGFKKFDDSFNWLHEKVYQWYFLKIFIVFLALFDLLDKIEIKNIFARYAVVVPIILFVVYLYVKPEDPKKIKKPTQSVNRFLRLFNWLNEKMTNLHITLYQMHTVKYIIAIFVAAYYTTIKISFDNKILDVVIGSSILIFTILLFMRPRDHKNEDDK
ncbi:hypothetical protein AAK938_09140 [Aerococcaceae bacterium 50-4]